MHLHAVSRPRDLHSELDEGFEVTVWASSSGLWLFVPGLHFYYRAVSLVLSYLLGGKDGSGGRLLGGTGLPFAMPKSQSGHPIRPGDRPGFVADCLRIVVGVWKSGMQPSRAAALGELRSCLELAPARSQKKEWGQVYLPPVCPLESAALCPPLGFPLG